MSIGKSITSVTSQEKIIKQIAFPKSVLPISVVLSNAVNLVISLFVIIVIGLFFGIYPTVMLVYLPLIFFIQVMWTFGLCLFFSIIGVSFLAVILLFSFSSSPSMVSLIGTPINNEDELAGFMLRCQRSINKDENVDDILELAITIYLYKLNGGKG